MSLHCADNIGLHLVLHALTEEVTIKKTGSASKSILFVFVVILFKVIDDSSTHVSVVFTWTEGWEHIRSGLLVQVGTKEPAWCKDDPEEQEDKRDTLFGILNER